MQKYVVGFDIADVRNLKPEGEAPTCDPFVVVQCCGKTYKTTVKENKRLHVPINESQIWNDIELNEEKFETAYIEFSVYARNFWWRDYLIGKASLQLLSVNRRKAHIYFKKTVPLRKENEAESTGSITLTVWCLVPGESAPTASQMADAAVENEDGEKEEFDVDLTKAVLGATEGQQEGSRYHLIVNVFRVEDLALVKGNYPSPFVTVEFAGTCRSTEAASNAAQFTYNSEIRIPVQAPICEDVVLIKLWTQGSFLTLTPDLLLAQGLLSFGELRNNALPPRWFCLYGWNPDEVNIEEVTRTGERILPNFFKGRLLISGRVERIKDGEELKDAHVGRAQQPVEPEMRQVALMADVYQVCGAVGKECQVRLAFGAREQKTQDWVTASRQRPDPAWEHVHGKQPALEDRDNSFGSEVDTSKTRQEDMVTFQFTQKQGRIPPLVDMTPEDIHSQPYIMVNIYTRGIMSGELRVGYQMRRLADFPKYDPGSPSKPRFMAMEPMPNPYSLKTRTLSSVLMVIEHYTTDDVQRHDRKNVKPMSYIVRAYVFMARNIRVDNSKNYAVRVTCAGMSKSTKAISEVRPMWMQCLELPIMLCSDHPREQPTMFPITVHLCHQNPILAQTRDDDIGKTVCVYEYMRRKDNMDRWEIFKLQPQWVQLKGGTYGSRVTGEVLVAFELLHARDRMVPQCAPKPMWPAGSEEEFNEQEHFSYLRKATLHVAMYGLRDLKLKKMPASMEPAKDLAPMVEVRVKKFRSQHHAAEEQEEQSPRPENQEEGAEENDAPKSNKDSHIDEDNDKFYQLGFKYREALEGGDRDNKDDRLNYWYSDAVGGQNNLNYEIFQVKTKQILLPDKVLLQPFIAFRVLERPTTFSEFKSTKSWLTGKFGNDDWQLMGEYRQSLSELYPCKWLHELYNHPRDDPSESNLRHAVEKAKEGLQAKPKFEEESAEERAEAMRREREKQYQQERAKVTTRHARLIEPEEKIPEAVDTAAMPLALRIARQQNKTEAARPLHSKSVHLLNMDRGAGFKTRYGEKGHRKADRMQSVLPGKLESRKPNKGFKSDFYFENRPLLQGHDLIDPYVDGVDYNYCHKDCYGFVKCAFKLTDGWGEEEEESKGQGALPVVQETDRAIEEEKVQEVAETIDEDTYENGGLGAAFGGLKNKVVDAWENLQAAEDPLAATRLVGGAALGAAGAALGAAGKVTDAAKGLALQAVDVVLHDHRAHSSDSHGQAHAAKDTANEARRRLEEQRRLKNSFGVSEELEEFAFCETQDPKRFAKRFKKDMPSRIRVRIYFVKAICIMGKPGGQDPYLRFKLGKAYDVSMRNAFQPKTSTPSFYRVEERDIRMPEDARLVVDMYDHEDLHEMVGPVGSMVCPEKLIGSTTIDLEDRWHSVEWQKCARHKSIPPEQRPLYNPEMTGQNCGSIEMWVEMLDSMRASEEKAADLRKPPEEQVEVRIVIWTCSEVPLLDGSGADMYSDVQVAVKLECNQYKGEEYRFPREQETDIHNHCTTGNAVFNWRIVFPRIRVPTDSCTLDITLKEVDTLSSDLIGQVTLDIRKYVEKVGRDMESVHSKADLKFHRMDAEANGPKKKEEDARDASQQTSAGRVQLEMWVLTHEEATAKEAGMGRGPPNDWPPLTTPSEGRNWGDVFAGVSFELPSFGIFWKILPLILFTLLCLVALRQTGLL